MDIKLEDISKVTMRGMVDDLNEIYPQLLKIKAKLFDMGYGLSDAGYHGWSGEPLKNHNMVIDEMEKTIDEGISICQVALGLELDGGAWESCVKFY